VGNKNNDQFTGSRDFSSNQCHPSFSGGRGMSCLANFLNISAYKGLEESRLRQVLLTARKTTG
jgi:hypothetical protein